MKPQTAALLEKFHLAKRLKFIESDKGLELEHDLSDQDKTELVKLEYGPNLAGTIDDLFVAIIKKVIKLSSNRVRQHLQDKLSEL